MNVACSTCLDSLTLESGISATPCGHVFHTDCITKWIESGQNNCSHCRAECQKKNIVKLFFSQNELGLQQNEVIDDISEENQKLLKQANDAKSRELEAGRKVEKILKEKFELKALINTHKNIELNVKRNFNKDKQGMLEQIEELNKEVTGLKSLIKTHKDIELNVKRNFNIDRQDMLEQIEELKKESTDLKLELKSLIKTHKNVELNVKRNFNIDKQDMLEQIEELKKEVNDLKLELKSLIKTHKNVEFNSKISFDIDKHYMLEQIEELKKEVTDLKSKLLKSIVTGDLFLLRRHISNHKSHTSHFNLYCLHIRVKVAWWNK